MSSPSDYTAGWICALPVEAVAATVFLDERLDGPSTQERDDTNSYKFGKIKNHYVVIATLPKGEYGTATAATVAKDLTRSFPNVRIGLMVGIGGGAPSSRNDIRLGDVVVSIPGKGQSGIFQYDYGESIQYESFQCTRALDQPPQLLRAAVASLEVDQEIDGNGIQDAIAKVLEQKPNLKRKYGRPSDDTDILYRREIIHTGGDPCDTCETDHTDVEKRESRQSERTLIHYGTIASANTLMKNAILRDRLASQNNVLCFEMEAAGLMNGFSCLVIRGICDYSDSHKNNVWQGYAAMAAAAYAKQIVSTIRPQQVEEEPRLGRIETQIREIAQTAQDVRSHQKKEADLSILSWLSTTDFGKQQTDNLRKWQPGTVKWLLDCPEYQKWLQEKGQVLFCPGIPGAGKTVAASVVVKDLTQRFVNDTDIGIVFVYCSYTQRGSQETISLLGGILKQLCQRQGSISQDVTDLYLSHGKGQTGPQYDEITKALKCHLGDYSRVMVVIDAVDEWQPTQNDRFNLVDELLHLHGENSTNLLVTSRFIPAIEERFKRYPWCRIEASQDDIHRYIDDYHWPSLSLVYGRPDLQQEIKSCVRQAANGMFLLAQFYLSSLEYKTTPREIKDALKQFQNRAERKAHDPNFDMLAEAYDEAMIRIDQQGESYKRKAHQVLSWVCYTCRGLYVRELQNAIAVREHEFDVHEDDLSDINLLLSVCCGIVVVHEATQTIQLVHYTAQDYFIHRQEDFFPDVHSYLAKQCINYLSLGRFEDGLPDTGGAKNGWWLSPDTSEARWYALYQYAAVYWGHHLRKATVSASNVDQAALNLLHNGIKISAAIKIQLWSMGPDFMPNLNSERRGNLSINGLHLAAFCGFDRVLPLLMATFDVNSKDSNGRTALGWASEAGWYNIVNQLLSADADVEAIEYDGSTSLHLASKFNRAEVVQILINSGADINIADNYGDTALHCAAMLGHDKIALKLLTNAARFDISNNSGQLPLNIAVQSWNRSVYETLCNAGANPRSCGTNMRTILVEAACAGDEFIVKSLLEQNVDLDAKDCRGRTALMEACEKGNLTVVDMLLRHNTRLDVKDANGLTVLMKVMVYSDLEVAVKLFQAASAQKNPYLEPSYFGAALLKACQERRETAVKVLLENGAMNSPEAHNGLPFLVTFEDVKWNKDNDWEELRNIKMKI
ncbi:hypothetical protein ACHAPA_006019 [Fusarium lateritium]